MYSLKESKISFEDMFLEIADKNQINKYNFMLYRPAWFDYSAEELPETIIAQVQVPSTYFRDRSLMDIEAQLNNRVKRCFSEYDFKGLFDIPFQELIKKDAEVIVIFPSYEEIPTETDIEISCLGVSSLHTNKNNEFKHMKHIDFGILVPEIDDADNYFDDILGDLNTLKTGEGWLVHSGNSFHFHGKEAVNQAQWNEYMQSLFDRAAINTILDEQWPYLQLERGYSILRIEKSLIKKKPKIIGEIKE